MFWLSVDLDINFSINEKKNLIEFKKEKELFKITTKSFLKIWVKVRKHKEKSFFKTEAGDLFFTFNLLGLLGYVHWWLNRYQGALFWMFSGKFEQWNQMKSEKLCHLYGLSMLQWWKILFSFSTFLCSVEVVAKRVLLQFNLFYSVEFLNGFSDSFMYCKSSSGQICWNDFSLWCL